MEQIAVSFTDWGVPKTWLSPKITILGKDWTVFIQNWECRELGYGWYIYNFAKYSPEKVYLYVFDGGSALSSDYDRYKFGGNEFDAYSNKYSWGRTAAPYFTSINGRFDRVDKLFKDAEKNRYKDTEVIKNLNDIKKQIKWSNTNTRLNQLEKILSEIKQSVVDTSSSVDWNSSKNFNGINGKLDLMAEYIVKMKEDVDSELNSVWDTITQSINDSNTSLSEWFSKNITIEQLLQQVGRLEDKMEEVLNTFMTTNLNWQLPKELVDKYDVSLNRKWLSEEDVMAALWIPTNWWNQYWLNQWMGEGMEMWMEEGMSEWLWEARQEQLNAPVDMQWIAEPEMPMTI
jgi:hypothetical protein